MSAVVERAVYWANTKAATPNNKEKSTSDKKEAKDTSDETAPKSSDYDSDATLPLTGPPMSTEELLAYAALPEFSKKSSGATASKCSPDKKQPI